MSRVREQLASVDESTLAFIGSSLGGFYATSLAEHYRAQAVLINPAVHPQERWHKYQGTHRNYHTGEPVAVTPEHTRELEALAPAGLARPQNYLVFLQCHDEVLDYRKAVAFYGDSQCVLRKDGDHSYAQFQRELPRAFSFLLSRMRLKAR